jgi:hypothetical protein
MILYIAADEVAMFKIEFKDFVGPDITGIWKAPVSRSQPYFARDFANSSQIHPHAHGSSRG